MKANWLLLNADATDATGGGGGDTANVAAPGENIPGQAAGASGEDLYSDEGGTGGEGAGQGDQGAQGGEGAQGEGAQGGEGQPAAEAALTATQVADIIAKAGLIVKQQQGQQGAGQPAQQQDMDEETFNKTFNVYFPDENVLAGLQSTDRKIQIAAFLKMRDGITKQVLTMAEYRREHAMDEFRKNEFNEVNQYVRTERQQKDRSAFFKANADLSKWETIVDSVADKLITQGKLNGLSVPEAQKLIAAEARVVLKTAGVPLVAPQAGNGNGAAANTSKPGQQQNGGRGKPQRQMSVLTGAGRSGGGASSGGAKGPPGSEVFD